MKRPKVKIKDMTERELDKIHDKLFTKYFDVSGNHFKKMKTRPSVKWQIEVSMAAMATVLNIYNGLLIKMERDGE